MADSGNGSDDMEVSTESQDSQETEAYSLEPEVAEPVAETDDQGEAHQGDREEAMEGVEETPVAQEGIGEEKAMQRTDEDEENDDVESSGLILESGNKQTIDQTEPEQAEEPKSAESAPSPSQEGKSEDTGQIEEVERGEDENAQREGEESVQPNEATGQEESTADQVGDEGERESESIDSETQNSKDVSKPEEETVDKDEKIVQSTSQDDLVKKEEQASVHKDEKNDQTTPRDVAIEEEEERSNGEKDKNSGHKASKDNPMEEREDTNVRKDNDNNPKSSKGDPHEPKKTQGAVGGGGHDSSSDSESDDDDWGRPWSRSDTKAYRRGYPGKKDNHPSWDMNYKFYTNRLQSSPRGDYIDRIHEIWWGNYDLLEMHHGYIQWLFPIRESGMNWSAQELQLHEIESIREDAEAHSRVLKSYEMMLDFYGMKLKDPKTGELERAENWQSRFRHLNRSMHNYLRITRILKCLGEFKYEHLKAPFIRFVLHEAIVHGTLRNTLNSCENYWLQVVRSRKQRKELKRYSQELRQGKGSSKNRT